MLNVSQTKEFDYFIDAVAELILAYQVGSTESNQEFNDTKISDTNKREVK